MKAVDVLIKCLENEDVKFVFGIVGKETIDLVHSLAKSNIQFIVVRHEQAAAFMADIYGRLTGCAGVCTATLGPGATNLVTGVATAYLDQSPIVAIAGQAGISRSHKPSHQNIHLKEIFEPITKWSIELKDANTIPEVIRNAFSTAQAEKPGPVYVSLPEDITTVDINERVLTKPKPSHHVPNKSSLKTAIDLINNSKQPFILAGPGIIRNKASDDLLVLAEVLNVPVAHSMMAKGVMPSNHPLNYFTFGFNQQDYVINTLQEVDLIIAVGLNPVEFLAEKWNIKKTPILHIDTLEATVDEYYPVILELVGDIAETIKNIQLEELQKKSLPTLREYRPRIMEAHRIGQQLVETKDSTTFNPYYIINEIEKLLTPTTIVISDVGAHKLNIARSLQPLAPNRVIISNGLATMGLAVPGGIAAKLACPDSPVIVVTGDGGFAMNMAELETAKRLNISFVILVLTDHMYGLEWKMMNEKYQSDSGVHFGTIDYVKFAEAFHISGLKITPGEDFSNVLASSLSSDEITMIEVPIDNKSF